jgi:major vault protein
MSELQKDLVLSINEYSYVLDETKGHVVCWVGPSKTSLSNSDKLVRFNTRSKSFEKCSYDDAINLFATAPENWYIILKNPVEGNKHPKPGANNLPEDVHIGRKVNVRGPVSFALYPGQMAKVVRGHALRSNQYLLARVYEAESASQSQGEMLDAEGNKIENKDTYVNGQILVIKGTEVSFYIPPTGIEVIPVNNDDRQGYVREAVTLERLEYCILKDEDGNKRYVHGPKVVFPKPTETFVTSPKGGYIFRAIELSKISGIYVKVIAEYEDEKNIKHPVGEELFITGADQMIYYPRPEHAIISYDNKLMHHAIAIPEGEGRYIMDRMSGEIKTVKGPAMYLPDPRTEVVVKRKLTDAQCKLWYPGNSAVLEYNIGLSEKAVEKNPVTNYLDSITAYCCSTSSSTTLANLEANASISRGTSYTKPRTITLDNKLDGVVSIDVWTGYAINVISKDGTRKVVCGPQTVLLDYDQTLESLELSTGNPKSTDRLLKTAYLKHENNKVSDTIMVETKDFVKASIKVSYCVDFDEKYMDKWFAVDNYVKYLCDRVRSLLKRAVKEYTISEFYQNYSDIVRNVTLGLKSEESDGERPAHYGHRFFQENGMFIHDVEVLGLDVERSIENMLLDKQYDMIQKTLELADAQREAEIAEALAIAEKKKQELRTQTLINKMELQKKEAEYKLEMQAQIARQQEAEEMAKKKAEADMQPMIDAIAAASINRRNAEHEAAMSREAAEHLVTQNHEQAMADIEKAKQEAYAKTVKSIMETITPDLIAAIETGGKCDLMAALTESMAPYAIAQGEGVVETTDRLLRGLPMETSLKEIFNGLKED